VAESSSIARPYAQAAFELARDSGRLGQWADLLDAAAMVAADPQIDRLIDAPRTDMSALIDMIVGICRDKLPEAAGDQSQLQNLLKLLAENGRLTALPDIAEQFRKLKADVENSIDVVLTAASQIDAGQQSRIAEALKKRLGREINLHFKLDENLIGGARLQADDLVIDGSVRTGLDKLASTLSN